MSRLFRPGLLLLSAIALAAAAEETPSTEVAVAGGYSKGLYRSYDGNWSALPLVQVESPYFYVRGLSAGARVFSSDDQAHEVLVGSTWQLGQAFKPGRADDRQLQQLDRRRDIVTADLAYNFFALRQWGYRVVVPVLSFGCNAPANPAFIPLGGCPINPAFIPLGGHFHHF